MRRGIIVLILICTQLMAQHSIASAGRKGLVSGFVQDSNSGESLIGANVFLMDTYYGSSTNQSGYYSLTGLPVGEYTVMCSYIGYESYQKKITINPGQKITLDIELNPSTILTQSVSVIADSVRTSERLYRKSVSKITMTPREIESAPQVVEADLLRTLQTMPGIASVSDFSSELYVRGGTPDQNLYMIDGTDVYNPEHLFGLFSTFNTDAIKNVEISKGGFGAEYGGRLSSVLDVTNLDGHRKEYTSKTSISLLSAKTTMQFPLGSLGAISGSIRRTYFDQTIGKSIDDIPDYYFYDGHLKAYLDLGRSDKLSLSLYKGKDDLEFTLNPDVDDSEVLYYDWGNTTASARWTHLFSPSLFGNFWVTSSRFDSYFEFENMNEENDAHDITVKGNLEYFYSQMLQFKMGFEYKDIDIIYNSDYPGGRVDITQTPKHLAGYVQSSWRISPLLEVQPGFRFNTCSNDGKTWNTFDPRLTLKYRLSEISNLKFATGKYHQSLFRIPRSFIADIWSSSDRYWDTAEANHYILGYQREVANDYELEIETYFKDYSHLYFYDYFFYLQMEPTQYTENGDPLYTNTKGLYDSGKGYAYGLDFLLRKDVGPLTGWVSYSLTKAYNKVDGRNNDQWFQPRHDRTHTFNLIANMDIKNFLRQLKHEPYHKDKKQWKMGLGFVFASGQPITTASSIYVNRPMPDQDFYHGYNLYPGEINSFRLPPYIRFDFSLTYVRHYKHFTLEPFLQVFNVTNRKNVWFITYEDELQGQKIVQNTETTGMLPTLPSIGVNIQF